MRMLVLAVIGAAAGWLIGQSAIPVIVGAIALQAIFFVGQLIYGLRVRARASAEVPVDLAGTPAIPDDQLQLRYAGLALAGRNATIAREVARIAGSTPEAVASLLPDLIGPHPRVERGEPQGW